MIKNISQLINTLLNKCNTWHCISGDISHPVFINALWYKYLEIGKHYVFEIY